MSDDAEPGASGRYGPASFEVYEHISLQVWSVTDGRDGLQAAGEILRVVGVVRDDPQNVVDEL
ncbi:hypothetical protein, partial [Streptomyces geysiriensis]|uniref:hypothetical protein n=1 Tax=Streptomyces geysiriensis TaxID=68207 RepID=UPI001C7CF759